MKFPRVSHRMAVIVGIIVALIGVGSFVFWNQMSFFSNMFREGSNKWSYRHVYSPARSRVVTVVIQSRVKFVDPTSKKYIVPGLYDGQSPAREKHIAFPPETGLVITWETEDQLVIVANQPPTHETQISKSFDVKTVISNVEYETRSAVMPDSTF